MPLRRDGASLWRLEVEGKGEREREGERARKMVRVWVLTRPNAAVGMARGMGIGAHPQE